MMDGGITLSQAEVVEITGTTRRRKQLEYFISLGIPASLNAANLVKVNRAAYHAKTMPSGTRIRQKTEPRLTYGKTAQN